MKKTLKALENGKYDIGECKNVKIKCVSELGWFDPQKLMEQVIESGGMETNQWTIPWDKKNSAGSCSLIDFETLDGKRHKFLLDTGWNSEYIDKCFKREGIDNMLKQREINLLIITHEHIDHYWGLETVLKYNPEITIMIPDTFYSEGIDFFNQTGKKLAYNGKLIQVKPGQVNKLYEGCASLCFDVPIILRVRGEQSLYFNVKDKGIVCVTGCCHQSITNFAEFAHKKIVGGENMYGVYGGLHIAPFGPMNPERENIINEMSKYNFKKIACNHCTGLVAVQKMLELGYPIVRGTGSLGSKSDLYIGNGDEVIF